MSTCIIGLVQGPTVWMAGDSAVSSDEPGDVSLVTAKEPKVFRTGPCLVGICGGIRAGQIVEHHLKVPARPARCSAYKWMATSFTGALRKAVKAAGGQSPNSEEPDQIDGEYLVGYQGKLFYIYTDYSVMAPAAPYAAVGSGAFGALCVMHATPKLSPKKRLLTALEAVEEYCASVRRPFVVEKI